MGEFPMITTIGINPFNQWSQQPDEIVLYLSTDDTSKLTKLREKCSTCWQDLLDSDANQWDWAGGGEYLAPGLYLRVFKTPQNPCQKGLSGHRSDATVVAKTIAYQQKHQVAMADALDHVLEPCPDLK